MNEKTSTYLLGFVALMTVVNTFLILSQDGGSGRVIQTPGENTALVEPSNNNSNNPIQFDNQKRKPSDQATPQQPKKPSGPPTEIAFEQMEHDFGLIDQNTENTYIFKFTNTGDKPLIIQDAKGSCGCTVPKYPVEPVPPGETGEIEVVYKPGKQKGSQSKSVTLTANTIPEQTILKISAIVQEVEGE